MVELTPLGIGHITFTVIDGERWYFAKPLFDYLLSYSYQYFCKGHPEHIKYDKHVKRLFVKNNVTAFFINKEAIMMIPLFVKRYDADRWTKLRDAIAPVVYKKGSADAKI